MVQDILQPLLSQSNVTDLTINVAQSGLTMDDKAALQPAGEGRVAVLAVTKAPLLFFPRRKVRVVGYLNAADSAFVMPRIEAGDVLRVRIVGLTPEHLARDGRASLQISVWGHLPYLRKEAKRPEPPARLTVPPLRKKSS